MFAVVETIGLQQLVDEYLRDKAKLHGQTKMATLIGTKRQGVNAILNRVKGRRFTWDHLERFVANSSMLVSTLLAEMAKLAWAREHEIMKPPQLPPGIPIDAGEAPRSTDERIAQTLEELAGLLRSRG